MCNFLSALVLKDGTVLSNPLTDSHSGEMWGSSNVGEMRESSKVGVMRESSKAPRKAAQS